tara:strand:- start:11726 stop:13396 length:1671 start_codon:yes stop_codon:yes gene_type:complete
MILRPYQEVAVKDASKALDEYGNTLVVAPTGAGKTIMLSALAGKRHKKGKRTLILQHRDELVSQNNIKFNKVNENISTSIVNGKVKNWEGEVVFSMVQTMSRENNLNGRPKFDLVIVDESHHVAAPTYKKIINAVKKDNDKVEIVGFTATPNRGDGKGLRSIFNNCSHQIELATLIREGFLVPLKAFVIDIGVREDLSKVRKLTSDYDMEQVDSIMNRRVINERVVDEWEEKAGDRKTIVFCSTISHAKGLLSSFRERDILADIVTGETPSEERAEILHDLEYKDLQVVVNVAVLTEGFDAQAVSCIILTRPCSYKSTMVQMIGRGLRIVDPSIHPNVIKKDCVVLDFGTSILTHGGLDDGINLDGAIPKEDLEAPVKICPNCEASVPLRVSVCPFCSSPFLGEEIEKVTLENFEMSEYDLMQLSPFMWIDIFGNGSCMMASGFQGFGLVATIDDTSVAIVKKRGQGVKTVAIGGKIQATSAADDFLRQIETNNAANKSKRWLNAPATDVQKNYLITQGVEVSVMDFSWTKYKAACWLNYLWNKKPIDEIVLEKIY